MRVCMVIFGILFGVLALGGCRSVSGGVDGLVAHYRFDGNVQDSSGFGNHGVGRGLKFVANRNGESESACSFKGLAAFVEVQPSESLRLTNGLSVAVWVNIKGYKNDWAPIICKGDSRSTREYAFNLSRLVEGFYQDENNDTYRNCIGARVSSYPGSFEWHHVAMVYDRNSTLAYLDGKLVGRDDSLDYLDKSGQGVLYIGMDPPGAIEFFAGEMDDLRIYNRPISESEVKAAMGAR